MYRERFGKTIDD